MAFSIIFSFRDEKNERRTTEINLPSGPAFSDVTPVPFTRLTRPAVCSA